MKTYNLFGYRITIEKEPEKKLSWNEYTPPAEIKPSFFQLRKLKSWARDRILDDKKRLTLIWGDPTFNYDSEAISIFFRTKISLIKACRAKWGWSLGQSKKIVEDLIGQAYIDRKWKSLL